MTDDIKALIEELIEHTKTGRCFRGTVHVAKDAAAALTAMQAENDGLRRDAELMRQELKNIANADTVEWDDPTQYEAWAKSRARHTLAALAQTDKEKPC